jgi:hypothetical protein
MVLINNYTKKVWVKPENKKSTWLLSGQKMKIDGFKPPLWDGDWLKLSDKWDDDATCTISGNGNFKLYNYNYGFLHGNSAVFKTPALYNRLPGRKKDPYSSWGSEPK